MPTKTVTGTYPTGYALEANDRARSSQTFAPVRSELNPPDEGAP